MKTKAFSNKWATIFYFSSGFKVFEIDSNIFIIILFLVYVHWLLIRFRFYSLWMCNNLVEIHFMIRSFARSAVFSTSSVGCNLFPKKWNFQIIRFSCNVCFSLYGILACLPNSRRKVKKKRCEETEMNVRDGSCFIESILFNAKELKCV